ncbi:MAG: RsmD family RNA methyltransferase [Lawsonella clevelandensis]
MILSLLIHPMHRWRRLAGILTALVENGWVADGSVIVLERSSRDTPTHWPAHYREYRSKKYGETRIDIAIVESTGNLAA